MPKEGKKRATATWRQWHGSLGNPEWPTPTIAVKCDDDARPGYATKKANEYLDKPAVLKAKVKLLKEMLARSQNCLAYTGAGISTASGISDYATKAQGSLATGGRKKIKNMWEAQPTLAHRVLVEMYKKGTLKYWVQQNHDGLPQKAGLPQSAINEIHGAWYDPSNPVVAMSGKLRHDLFKALQIWQARTDMCLCLGTSLVGMNADRTMILPAKRALKGNGVGSVIVALQQTQYDSLCQLRIFAKLDDVFQLLGEEMGIDLREFKQYRPEVPAKNQKAPDLFMVPYSKDGNPARKLGEWKLFKGAKVVVTDGRYEGDVATVVGKNSEGHYRIRLDDTKQEVIMGSWFVQAAVRGEVDRLPVVNFSEALHAGKRAIRPNDQDVGSLSGYASAVHSCPHIIRMGNTVSLSDAKALVNTPTCCAADCDNTTENWACLTCKKVLCGRFAKGHMVKHNKETGHKVAVGIGDLSFWCYGCRSYLHHLAIRPIYDIYGVFHLAKFGEKVAQPFGIR